MKGNAVMELSLLSKIVLVIFGICLIIFIIKKIIDKYIQSYFKSKSFAELNRKTDDIPDIYDDIKKMSHRLKQSVYVNFSPSTQDEMEMQNYHGDSFKRNDTIPKHTYLCTKEILNQYIDCPYALLSKYCGFSNNIAVNKYLSDILNKSIELQNIVNTFKCNYESTLLFIDSELPTMIKFFAKKKVLLMLGMQLEKDWQINLFPAYTFKQIDDYKLTIYIEFTPETLPEIIKYFS